MSNLLQISSSINELLKSLHTCIIKILSLEISLFMVNDFFKENKESIYIESDLLFIFNCKYSFELFINDSIQTKIKKYNLKIEAINYFKTSKAEVKITFYEEILF